MEDGAQMCELMGVKAAMGWGLATLLWLVVAMVLVGFAACVVGGIRAGRGKL
jgi:hypothetical protein